MIANHYLDPHVRSRVKAMLISDTSHPAQSNSIAFEATWADKYRESKAQRRAQTRQWYFVDIELSGPDENAACFGHPPVPVGMPASSGAADDCVVDKIDEFAAELKAPRTKPAERLAALQLLLHFVGDVHQPLHASDDHDRGGNDKHVSASGVKSGCLHSYWDTGFVQLLGTTPSKVANELIAKITTAQVQQWSQGSAADWAQESFMVAKGHTYGSLAAPKTLAKSVKTCDKAGSSELYKRSPAYVSDAKGIIATQLNKAGVRLAHVLNETLQ